MNRSLALALAGVLAMVPLAGCAGVPGGGTCYSMGATWREPGLYEAFPEPADDTSWNVTWDLDPPSLPFDNTTLDIRLGPERYHLTEVQWQGPTLSRERGGSPQLTLGPDGTLRTLANEHVSRDALWNATSGFLEAISDASKDTRDAWTDALVENRTREGEVTRGDGAPVTVIYRYHVQVSPPYRLGSLASDLNLSYPRSISEMSPGGFTTTTEPWTFAFRFPQKLAKNPQDTGERVASIRIDAFDHVVADVLQDTGNETRAVDKIQDAFASLGFGSPEVRASDVHVGAVC